MTERDERPFAALSKAERAARLVGNALDRDEEDIAFWRTATDTVRGQTLRRLLQLAQNILDSTPPRPEEPRTVPGIPAHDRRGKPPPPQP